MPPLNDFWRRLKTIRRVCLRLLADLRAGDLPRYAVPLLRQHSLRRQGDDSLIRRGANPCTSAALPVNTSTWPAAITLSQPLGSSAQVAAKCHNISLAATRLTGLLLMPGEMLSFFAAVGAPITQAGFVKSRAISGGRLTLETGGGLCQLSGLIYFISLHIGLNIVERHAHSVDLYDDAQRYAPLGSDATVAYGYKDLRVLNALAHPISLKISVTGDLLTASWHAPSQLIKYDISFTVREAGACRIVETARGAGSTGSKVIDRSCYIRRAVQQQ